MKMKAMTILFCCALICAACVQTKRVEVAPKPIQMVDPCPIPEGYLLDDATIAQAEASLRACPSKLDSITAALVEIGKDKPDRGHRQVVGKMLKGLTAEGKISEREAKRLYGKYFEVNFVSLPDLRPMSLPEKIDDIKQGLKSELEYKRHGLQECCGDKELYKRAEQEYGRLVNYMENLLYNQEYVRSLNRTY